MADVVDVGEAGSGVVVDPEVDHHPLADESVVDLFTDRGDAPDDVCALNSRELDGNTAPATRRPHRDRHLCRRPFTHPDVGVVHAARGDLDEDFVRGRFGNRVVLPVLEHLGTAVSGQKHRAHCGRQVGHQFRLLDGEITGQELCQRVVTAGSTRAPPDRSTIEPAPKEQRPEGRTTGCLHEESCRKGAPRIEPAA